MILEARSTRSSRPDRVDRPDRVGRPPRDHGFGPPFWTLFLDRFWRFKGLILDILGSRICPKRTHIWWFWVQKWTKNHDFSWFWTNLFGGSWTKLDKTVILLTPFCHFCLSWACRCSGTGKFRFCQFWKQGLRVCNFWAF